jgi:hypothetical protein
VPVQDWETDAVSETASVRTFDIFLLKWTLESD